VSGNAAKAAIPWQNSRRGKQHTDEDSQVFFAVDTNVLQCYNAQKEEFFGGESPNALQMQFASEAADLPGRAGLLSRQRVLKQHPTHPGR